MKNSLGLGGSRLSWWLLLFWLGFQENQDKKKTVKVIMINTQGACINN